MPPRSVLGAMSAWASAKRGFCSPSGMRDCRLARSEEQPRCIFRVPFGGLWLSGFSTACARPARKLRRPRQQEAAASSFHGRSERGWKAGGGRKREADPMQPPSLPRPVQQIRAAPAALLARCCRFWLGRLAAGACPALYHADKEEGKAEEGTDRDVGQKGSSSRRRGICHCAGTLYCKCRPI